MKQRKMKMHIDKLIYIYLTIILYTLEKLHHKLRHTHTQPGLLPLSQLF